MTGTTTFSGEINLYDGRNLTIETPTGSVVDFSNQFTNNGGLIKNGDGTAILSRAAGSSFTGTTTVNAGTLLVNNTSGNGTGGGPTIVNSGGAFGGTGHINNSSGPGAAVTVQSGGILVAGLSPTTSFNIEGYLILESGSHIALVLGPGLDSSQLVKGWGAPDIWTVSDTLTFDLTLLADATVGTYEDVLDVPGLTLPPSLANWIISTPGVMGSFINDEAGHVDLVLTAVPEPSVGLLLGLGLGALLFRRRREASRCE